MHEAMAIEFLGVRIATSLGTAWQTVHDAVLAEGRRLLIDDPSGSYSVRVSGR